jgi:hypothetical protein
MYLRTISPLLRFKLPEVRILGILWTFKKIDGGNRREIRMGLKLLFFGGFKPCERINL